MIKSTYTKPKGFINKSPTLVVWADKVYLRNNEICLYFNSAIHNRFIQLTLDELGDFDQAIKVLSNLYRKNTKEDEQAIQSRVWSIAGDLFRMGVIQ